MNSTAASVGFQYRNRADQHEAALTGMWLFLATEVLFFGGLLFCFVVGRHANPLAFDAAARETTLWAGTVNTVLLLTSSLAYAAGIVFMRAGNSRRLMHCCWPALALGGAFIALKFGVEWPGDIAQHLFPAAASFKIGGALEGGARLFFVFYFVSTGLHGLHMLIGVALVIWIMLRARRGEFSAHYHTPVVMVGLYWSFVDIVWLTLYPMIYLVGRG
jgi:cytochrome c oxidase subunit 3